ECPKTVENFCTHARNGYYDRCIFHRVIKGFMIQTGDPNGDGTGVTKQREGHAGKETGWKGEITEAREDREEQSLKSEKKNSSKAVDEPLESH
ncbi:UNVERIFIED_CONTAM: hypothetical protein H355_011240, partial [Colinus virginianus]